MNRERVKELLPILGAFVEGKDIQFRLDNGLEHKWLDMPDNEDLCITFPADDYEYRLKPAKPREWWYCTNNLTDPTEARMYPSPAYDACVDNWKHYIKVREVE